MRLRVLPLPGDHYLLVLDAANTPQPMTEELADQVRRLGRDITVQHSGGSCHGMMIFGDAIELPGEYRPDTVVLDDPQPTCGSTWHAAGRIFHCVRAPHDDGDHRQGAVRWS